MNDADAYASFWQVIESDEATETPQEVLDAYAEFSSMSND